MAKKLEQQLAELDKKIEAYQQQLTEQDITDDKAGLGSLAGDQDLANKIVRLKKRQAEKKALQNQLSASSDSQISTVDSDARLLTKRGQTTAGYNVQIAVANTNCWWLWRSLRRVTPNNSCRCWIRRKRSWNLDI
jgi:hypothetical protein